MNNKIKFLGLALLSFIIISTSCSKKTDDKIEEVLGPIFTVSIAGGDNYKSTTGHGQMVAGKFLITSDKADKEIFLFIKKFEKGKYKFDDLVNNATFTMDKSDPTKIFTSVKSASDWVEITKIHTDNTTFDGKFSFTCQNAAGDAKVITGTWVNLKKK